MKKINSILAIAAVALTSVVGFTSCDKNDDAFSNQAPVVKGTADTGSTTADKNTTATDNNASGNLLGAQQSGSITLGVDGLTRTIGTTFEDPYAVFTVSNPEGLEVEVSTANACIVVSPDYVGGNPSNDTQSFKTSEKSFKVYSSPANKFDFKQTGTATVYLKDSKSTKSVTFDYCNKNAAYGYTAWASWSYTFKSVAQ